MRLRQTAYFKPEEAQRASSGPLLRPAAPEFAAHAAGFCHTSPFSTCSTSEQRRGKRARREGAALDIM